MSPKRYGVTDLVGFCGGKKDEMATRNRNKATATWPEKTGLGYFTALLASVIAFALMVTVAPAAYAEGGMYVAAGSAELTTQDDGSHGEVLAQGACGDNARFTWYADRTVVVSPVVAGQPAKVGTYGEDWAFDVDGGQLTLASDKAAYKAKLAQLEESCPIETLVFEDGVTEVGEFACAFIEELRTLRLPAHMDRIGDCAFAGCENLYTATLPERLGEWSGDRAFYRAPLKEAVLPLVENGTGRAADLLGGCQVLESLGFAEGVTDVTSVSANGCDFGYAIDSAARFLRKITFPSTLGQVNAGMLDPYQALETVEFKGNLVLDDATRNLFSDSYDPRYQGLKTTVKVAYPFEATGFAIADAGGVASSRIRVKLDPKGEVNYLISQVPADPAAVTIDDADAIYGAWNVYWENGFYWKEGVSDPERAQLSAAMDALWTVEMAAAWPDGAPAADPERGAVVSYGLCGQNARYTWYEDGTLVCEPIVAGRTASVSQMNNGGERWVLVDAATGTQYRSPDAVGMDRDFSNFANSLKDGPAVKLLIARDGITRIEKFAFAYRESLRRVELPEHMEYLGSLCFNHCSALREAVLPKTVETDWGGGGQFQDTALEAADLPLVDDGSGRALQLYSSVLKRVSFPDGCTQAYGVPGSVTAITLPGSVGRIDSGLYDGLINLEWVRFKGDFPALDDVTKNLFTNRFAGHATVYYPYGAAGFAIGRSGAVASNVWTDVKLLAVPDYNAIPDAGAVTLADADRIRSAQAFEAGACDEARTWATGDPARLAPAVEALDALELAAAKDAAKVELAAYADPGAYREAQQGELAAAVASGRDAIDAATDTAGVDAALASAKAAIDGIPTDAQMTAAERALADAKSASAAELAGYRDASLYRPVQQVELAAAVASGSTAIDAAADIAGVRAALADAKAAIDKIRTAAQLDAEEAGVRAADVANATVTVGAGTYTGSAVTPAVTVKLSGKTLAAGTDYTVAWANNVAVGSSAKVTVTGKGAYHGSKTAAFSIAKAKIAGATVTVAAATYTGSAVRPAVTVKLGGRTLKAGTDYELAWSGNVGAGKAAKVKVTGKGSYEGSKAATFAIGQAKNSANAAKAKVTKTFKVKTLKKKAQKVALPKVTCKFGKAAWKVAAKDKKGVLKLKGGKVTVKKGAKKGTYTIKLKAAVKATANWSAATTKAVTVKVTVK